MLSAGLLPVGSTYKVVAVKCDKSSTWLTATRNTLDDALDGQSILDEIYDEVSTFKLYYYLELLLVGRAHIVYCN